MRIACICSSYRRPTCLKTTLAQFRAFNIPEGVEAKLFILEDSGEWSCDIVGHDFRLCSRVRFGSMGEKHQWLCQLAFDYEFDAVMIMDDDDIYMPDHLAGHVKALESSRLSIPARKVVDCHRRNPVGKLTQSDLTEESKPNPWNHGSWAFMLSLWQEVGGYDKRNRDDFDLDFGNRCLDATGGACGNYTDWIPPQYGYRWGSAPDRLNASGRGAGYYDLHRDDSPTVPRYELTAAFDTGAVEWRRLMAERYGGNKSTAAVQHSHQMPVRTLGHPGHTLYSSDAPQRPRRPFTSWVTGDMQTVVQSRGYALFAAWQNPDGTATCESEVSDEFRDVVTIDFLRSIRVRLSGASGSLEYPAIQPTEESLIRAEDFLELSPFRHALATANQSSKMAVIGCGLDDDGKPFISDYITDFPEQHKVWLMKTIRDALTKK